MREILFRGKRKDNGEWVFGCYYKQSEFYGDKVDDHIIITSHEDLSFDQALDYYDVQPETVGQFTGLTDKNGKKIFEGDIVKASEMENPDFVGEIRWNFECWTVSGANWADSLNMANHLHKLEVIGNIHDNPDLLKGGAVDG